MTLENIGDKAALAAAADLRSSMQGKVVLPCDRDYADVRIIWNGAVEHQPALIARCETTRDVQYAIRTAATYGLRLAVRGGGHDWAGRSVCHDGLMIDLSAMRQVNVEVATKAAVVAGGATAADVVDAAAPHGLVAVTGNCGTVGMAGLTLGGGYGLLNGKYGLALDNLLGAEVVLANGQFVSADATHNAELFWALRGGGGNFGIITAMRIRLHPMRSLLAGMILFPWSEAERVLSGYAELVASAPDNLTVLVCAICEPDGKPALLLAPAWCGELKDGEPMVAALQNLGNPMTAQTGPMAYRDLVGMFNAHLVVGRHHAMQTRWLPGLTADTISALCAAAAARTSPLSVIALHHCHGAAARVRAGDTAFGLRREHFLLEILASWEPNPQDDGAGHRRWAQNLSEALAPAALPGGYANLLGPNDREQIASAYGNNLTRLQHAKRRFDPDHVFSATPLPLDERPAVADQRPAASLSLSR
jgi:FAD/FMN-containing dehydrogenase